MGRLKDFCRRNVFSHGRFPPSFRPLNSNHLLGRALPRKVKELVSHSYFRIGVSHPSFVPRIQIFCLVALYRKRRFGRSQVVIRNSFLRNGVFPTLGTSSNTCVYSQFVFRNGVIPTRGTSSNKCVHSQLVFRNGVFPALGTYSDKCACL